MSSDGQEMLAMKIDYVHSLFQEMEDEGRIIPMADYMTIYGYLEDVREYILNPSI
jgi:hypothetical protein